MLPLLGVLRVTSSSADTLELQSAEILIELKIYSNNLKFIFELTFKEKEVKLYVVHDAFVS